VKVLVIGQGSIGKRHARILREEGHSVATVSRFPQEGFPNHQTIEEACREFAPGYVVIANRTHEHLEALRHLAATGFSGTVLVEKPLSAVPAGLPRLDFRRALVAYNLRFHPLLQRLSEKLRDEQLISVQIYAGQYLPDWRPQSDYRAAYSSHRAEGGGVLLDLSHEADYLLWLCGGWKRVTGIAGHFSPLEIDSEDLGMFLAETEGCPAASVQVNYLDRKGFREVIVNTRSHTFRVNLVEGTFQEDGVTEHLAVDRDYTYRAMHRSVLEDEQTICCDISQGMEICRFIDAIKRSSHKGVWITSHEA